MKYFNNKIKQLEEWCSKHPIEVLLIQITTLFVVIACISKGLVYILTNSITQ